MPEEEQSLVLGLTQFEEAIKLINEKKLTESEKYLNVCVELLPWASKNPINIFSSKMNLLLLLTYSDIEKA